MSAPSSSAPMPFVIMVSGAGTNCMALLERAKASPERFRPVGVISDRAGAPALDLAAQAGVPTFVVGHREESTLLALLRRLAPRWALLAGYKRLVGRGFLDFFADEGFHRVLNVHPSLLPAYPGLGGYERAFRDGVKLSGVTVHLVDSGLDTGLAVLQEAFAREESDTLEMFSERGRRVEHRLYARALELAAEGRIRPREGAGGVRWVSLAEGAFV